jgi:hypothetical protein
MAFVTVYAYMCIHCGFWFFSANLAEIVLDRYLKDKKVYIFTYWKDEYCKFRLTERKKYYIFLLT